VEEVPDAALGRGDDACDPHRIHRGGLGQGRFRESYGVPVPSSNSLQNRYHYRQSLYRYCTILSKGSSFNIVLFLHCVFFPELKNIKFVGMNGQRLCGVAAVPSQRRCAGGKMVYSQSPKLQQTRNNCLLPIAKAAANKQHGGPSPKQQQPGFDAAQTTATKCWSPPPLFLHSAHVALPYRVQDVLCYPARTKSRLAACNML